MQVRQIRASDQQNEARDAHQQAQILLVILFHLGDASQLFGGRPSVGHFAAALLQARRIDNGEVQIAELGLARATVARHPRLVVDQRQLLADEPVEQSGFADIRQTDDADR